MCGGELCFKCSAKTKLVSVLNLQESRNSFFPSVRPFNAICCLPYKTITFKMLFGPINFFFIEVSVQSQESEWVVIYLCVRVSILNCRRFFIYIFHLDSIFILDLKTFATEWYFCFSLYLKFLDFFPLIANFTKNNKLCYHLTRYKVQNLSICVYFGF